MQIRAGGSLTWLQNHAYGRGVTLLAGGCVHRCAAQNTCRNKGHSCDFVRRFPALTGVDKHLDGTCWLVMAV